MVRKVHNGKVCLGSAWGKLSRLSLCARLIFAGRWGECYSYRARKPSAYHKNGLTYVRSGLENLITYFQNLWEQRQLQAERRTLCHDEQKLRGWVDRIESRGCEEQQRVKRLPLSRQFFVCTNSKIALENRRRLCYNTPKPPEPMHQALPAIATSDRFLIAEVRKDLRIRITGIKANHMLLNSQNKYV